MASSSDAEIDLLDLAEGAVCGLPFDLFLCLAFDLFFEPVFLDVLEIFSVTFLVDFIGTGLEQGAIEIVHATSFTFLIDLFGTVFEQGAIQVVHAASSKGSGRQPAVATQQCNSSSIAPARHSRVVR